MSTAIIILLIIFSGLILAYDYTHTKHDFNTKDDDDWKDYL